MLHTGIMINVNYFSNIRNHTRRMHLSTNLKRLATKYSVSRQVAFGFNFLESTLSDMCVVQPGRRKNLQTHSPNRKCSHIWP